MTLVHGLPKSAVSVFTFFPKSSFFPVPSCCWVCVYAQVCWKVCSSDPACHIHPRKSKQWNNCKWHMVEILPKKATMHSATFFFLPRCNLVTNIFLYLACRVWTTQQWTLIVQYSQRLGVIVIQENPKLIWQLSLEIISESASCSLTDLVTKIILTGLSKETRWE